MEVHHNTNSVKYMDVNVLHFVFSSSYMDVITHGFFYIININMMIMKESTKRDE